MQKRYGGTEVLAKTRLKFMNYFVITEKMIKLSEYYAFQNF